MGSARLVCRTQLLLYRASAVVALPRIDFLGYIGLYSVERSRKGTLHGWDLLGEITSHPVKPFLKARGIVQEWWYQSLNRV